MGLQHLEGNRLGELLCFFKLDFFTTLRLMKSTGYPAYSNHFLLGTRDITHENVPRFDLLEMLVFLALIAIVVVGRVGLLRSHQRLLEIPNFWIRIQPPVSNTC